jgi:glycosyltransferase involved in cell wall biosynthesis
MVSLGFVTGSLAWRSPGGSVWTNAGLGRLIEAVAARVDKLRVAISFTTSRQDQHDHELRLPPHAIHFLPSMPSAARGLWRGAACARVMRGIEGSSDVMIVQLPFSAPTALFERRRPRVYHVCADIRGVVGASRHYRGARRIAANVAACAVDEMQRAALAEADTRAVTNGAALLSLYPRARGRTVVSSALKGDEIASRRRARPLSAPFIVLFVGYLRPEKGIDVLVAAFRNLLVDVPDARLQIIGGIDAVEIGAAEAAHRALTDLIAAGSVEIVGALPFGPELFQRYADADVLVLPSRSEGTPRVLVEARAFGCPVVATRVGGIPSSVSDGVDGLLVEPDDAQSLARAILRIKNDSALRAKLVENGTARARATTVDAQAEALLAEARSLLL